MQDPFTLTFFFFFFNKISTQFTMKDKERSKERDERGEMNTFVKLINRKAKVLLNVLGCTIASFELEMIHLDMECIYN